MTTEGKATTYEAELEAAADLVRHHEIALAVAKAQRDKILRASEGELSRRSAARITGLTSGRVQQIIERERTRN